MKRRAFFRLAAAALALAPGGVGAQQRQKTYRLAVMRVAGETKFWNETAAPRSWRPFFEELRRRGFVEGENLEVQRVSGLGQSRLYPDLVRSVVAAKPDVIFAAGNPLMAVLKEATASIPIVGITADPIAAGLVASLAHPGGNITGVTIDAGTALYAKNLQLLRQAVPGASRIGYLIPRALWDSFDTLAALKEAARQVGIALVPALVEGDLQEAEYRRAFAAMLRDGVDAFMVHTNVENQAQSRLIIGLAAASRLPAFYANVFYVERGGLMAYEADLRELYRHAAGVVAEILAGARPGDIPIYQPERFDLVINMKTAKTLGIDLPLSLLAQADEVIE